VRGVLGQVGQRRHQVHGIRIVDEQPVLLGRVRLQAERLLVKALRLDNLGAAHADMVERQQLERHFGKLAM